MIYQEVLLVAKVLCVDDEKNVRNLMRKVLEDEGYEVVAVSSGEEAQELLNRERFNILTLDLKLPGISGIDLLKKLQEEGMEVPAIVISAIATPEAIVEAMKNGAVDFLSKPFSPEELLEKVKGVLEMEKMTFNKMERIAKNLIEKGKYDESEKIVRKMFSLVPSSPIPHYLYSLILSSRGNKDLALKHLKAALTLDGNYHPAREELKKYEEEN